MQTKEMTLSQKLAHAMMSKGNMKIKDKIKLCRKLGIEVEKHVFTVKRGTTTYLQRK